MGYALITIDHREGKAFFANHLPFGITTMGHLEYGDVSFLGNGPNNQPIMIGIERKSIGDLLNSITSGRFAGHQLPGLLNSYGVVYIIVEGLYRPGGSGLLETRQGSGWAPINRGRRWMYTDVECWLTTMEQKAGLFTRRSPGPTETAAIIIGLYRWYTSKDYEDHRAHLTLHRPPE